MIPEKFPLPFPIPLVSALSLLHARSNPAPWMCVKNTIDGDVPFSFFHMATHYGNRHGRCVKAASFCTEVSGRKRDFFRFPTPLSPQTPKQSQRRTYVNTCAEQLALKYVRSPHLRSKVSEQLAQAHLRSATFIEHLRSATSATCAEQLAQQTCAELHTYCLLAKLQHQIPLARLHEQTGAGTLARANWQEYTCTSALAGAHLQERACTSALARSHLHERACTSTLARAPLHERACTSALHQRICTSAFARAQGARLHCLRLPKHVQKTAFGPTFCLFFSNTFTHFPRSAFRMTALPI